MTDPSKPKPVFSFDTTTPSSGGGGQLGQPASSAPSSGGLFGSAAPTPASTAGGLFGRTSTSTAPSGSLFGASAGGQAASSFGGASSGSGLFGGGSKPATTGGFSIGPSTSSDASAGTATFGFSQQGSQANQPPSTASAGGLFSTPSKSTDTPTANPFSGASGGGGLFGNKPPVNEANNITPTSKQTPSLFGNSTTPAGPPPGASMGAGGGTMFSSDKSASQLKGPPGNLFGGLGKATGNPSTSKPSTPSLFASPSGQAADSNKPESSQAQSQPPNLFGRPQKDANSGSISFSNAATASQSQSQNGLFSNPNPPQNQAGNKPTEKPPIPSLFSNLGGQSSSDSQAAKNTSAPFENTTSQPSLPPFSFANASMTPAASSGTIKSPTLASSGASAPSTAAPKTSFFPSLGQQQGKPNDTTGTSAPPSGAPSASASNMFGSIGKSATPVTTSQAQSKPPVTTAAPTETSKSTINNLSASTTGPAPPARSRLKDKTMDDIITRWASDLSKYQKEFQTQAEKVASWDRMLVENSEKIQRLYGSTLEAERATTEVERQLTSVESDQAELEAWLDHYEKEVDSMIQNQVGQGEGLSGPDQERERTYQLATKLSDRLDDMGKDLGSMIEEINDASSNLSKHAKADDPLTQVVRVLNSHLTQLQQIDQGAASLQMRVKESQKAGQSMGPPSGLSGPSSDAAEGFYRSYLGRG